MTYRTVVNGEPVVREGLTPDYRFTCDVLVIGVGSAGSYAALAAAREGAKVIAVEALRNVIQTRGDNSYRVAYCSFDAQGLEIPPGTTAEARIYYGTTNFWLFLLNL